MQYRIYLGVRAAAARLLPALCLLLLAACGEAAEAPQRVHSYLEGQISVAAEVDSIPDFRDFEVFVLNREGDEMDTLGYAVTDLRGHFNMDVVAPDRGIYPLVIRRHGTILKVDELAVAEGDTATMNVLFPVGNRPLRIRSRENAAWMAYKNTKTQFNQSLFRLASQNGAGEAEVARSVGQAASILWSMRDNYAGTVGGDLAAAESVVMLSGWNDSLLVARARQIEPENPSYEDVARTARRAQARLEGPEAGLALLREFMERAAGAEASRADEETLAALHSELVIAYLDGGRIEEAKQAARELAERYPASDWAAWADRVLYDFEHLMPGMEAPFFTATTRQGETVRLDSLRGRPVLLEFYTPVDEQYRNDLDARRALLEAAGDTALTIISVSVQPDTLLNEAFLGGRNVPGIHIYAPAGLESDLAERYNVHTLPRRFLIDREGKIVAKYEGTSISALQRELNALLGEAPPPS